jgi:CRP/FNR family transcriptional regulator, anaerobic regulatory protein
MATSLALNDPETDALRIRQASDGGCDVQELAALAGVGVTVTVCAGQTIVIEGDSIRHHFRIISGTVRLYKAIADGRRQVIDFLGGGDCFGLTGLDRHTYSAEAVSPVTLIRYPRQKLEATMQLDSRLARALFRLACAELDEAQQQMLLLGRKSADEKIASFLLGLAKHGEAGPKHRHPLGPVVYLPMLRQDMADYLGLTIETVSRTMSRFRRLGLIDLIGRHHVVLREVARLRAMAEGMASETAHAAHVDRREQDDAVDAWLQA